MHRRLVYIYLLNVPSFSSRYFKKKTNVSFREIARLIARNSLEVYGTCVLNPYQRIIGDVLIPSRALVHQRC